MGSVELIIIVWDYFVGSEMSLSAICEHRAKINIIYWQPSW